MKMNSLIPLSGGIGTRALGDSLSYPGLGQEGIWKTFRDWMDKGDEVLEWGVNQGLQVLPFVVPPARGFKFTQPLRMPVGGRPTLRLPPVRPPVATPTTPPPVATPWGGKVPVTPPKFAEQPQSWRPNVATPGGVKPQPPPTMPTKPMTPEGPLMGPPVATPRGQALYKGTEGAPDVPTRSPMGPGNMPAGYGPLPKSVPMPPSVPKWYDPVTGEGYGKIDYIRQAVKQSGEFNTPRSLKRDPVTGQPLGPMPIPNKPFSKGEGEPEREAVASVDPRTAQQACTGPGMFWDGRECRGSVGSMPGLPGGFPGSVAANTATMVSPGVTGMSGRRISYRIANI